MTAKKPEPPFVLDMDFGEALGRYAKTRPEEVEPPAGRKRKEARSAPDFHKDESKG